jgi:alpha-ketoglutarate-dependent taurine dioxygenase
MSHAPLFQVKMVMQNVPETKLELPGLMFTLMDIDQQTAKYDMALYLLDEGTKLIGFWNYNTDLFTADTITRMVSNFETLLNDIVARPDAPLNKINMLTDDEKTNQSVQRRERKESRFKKFINVAPKAVSLSPRDLIETEYLNFAESFPLVIRPVVEGADLIGWIKGNRDFVETELLKHGAILFRAFHTDSNAAFEQVAAAGCTELFGDYSDLPREENGGKVYDATPYPPEQAILFHNESSHLSRWPMRIWFYCVKAASEGGETPIVDCRKVYEQLDPKIIARFAEKRLKYVRNYTPGLDVSWQEFFRTSDRAEVEAHCRRAKMDFEWRDGDALRTSQICEAIATHPATGEKVFFNQIQLHHLSCLDRDVRASMLSVFDPENLPRHVYYGDGTPLEDTVVEQICELYQKCAVSFRWRVGDILMVDNMLTAHARNKFVGARKIMVAMGDMVSGTEIHN